MNRSLLCAAAVATIMNSQVLAGWDRTQSVDRLDGTVSQELRLTAESTIISPHRRAPINSQMAQILVTCDPKNLVAVVGVAGQLVAGSKSKVSYRIDQQPPVVTTSWSAATSNDSIGLWTKKSAAPLLERLSKAKELFVRIEHDVFGTTEAVFKLDGMAEAIDPLKKSCRL